jgi:protein involved in polysaccharide export with SLBB domain
VIRNHAAPDDTPSRRSATAYVISGSTALLVITACLLVVGALLGAQEPTTTTDGATGPLPAVARGSYATRAYLEQLVAAGGPQAPSISARLANGDFQVGDRIALQVTGEPALSDTFAVREGQVLRLPNMADIALHGVLHSELDSVLTQDLARYLRDPEVRASPLIRLAVVGGVLHPGYYSAPADALLSDMLTRAGGAIQTVNLSKTIIRRNGLPLLNAGQVSYALSNGKTIDQMSLLPGDEMVVGERNPNSALTWLYAIGAILGITVSLVLLSHYK